MTALLAWATSSSFKIERCCWPTIFVEFLDDEVLVFTCSRQGLLVLRAAVNWFYEEVTG